MTFTIDGYMLNVIDFSEACEPVGSAWHVWESGQIAIKGYVYDVKRTWRLRCIEKDVEWEYSAALYLQGKMASGETVLFAADEGDRFILNGVEAYIESLEIVVEATGNQNIRFFTVTLEEK